MAILSLYELAISRGFTVALRLTPMLDGYTVRIQVGSYQGPCPRFEKHFTWEMPVVDAVDAMARYPSGLLHHEQGRNDDRSITLASSVQHGIHELRV